MFIGSKHPKKNDLSLKKNFTVAQAVVPADALSLDIEQHGWFSECICRSGDDTMQSDLISMAVVHFRGASTTRSKAMTPPSNAAVPDGALSLDIGKKMQVWFPEKKRVWG